MEQLYHLVPIMQQDFFVIGSKSARSSPLCPLRHCLVPEHLHNWAFHDDVIKWKRFPFTGPLCGEFTGPSEFLAQRPVTRSFDVFFDLRLNKRLSKQS